MYMCLCLHTFLASNPAPLRGLRRSLHRRTVPPPPEFGWTTPFLQVVENGSSFSVCAKVNILFQAYTFDVNTRDGSATGKHYIARREGGGLIELYHSNLRQGDLPEYFLKLNGFLYPAECNVAKEFLFINKNAFQYPCLYNFTISIPPPYLPTYLAVDYNK